MIKIRAKQDALRRAGAMVATLASMNAAATPAVIRLYAVELNLEDDMAPSPLVTFPLLKPAGSIVDGRLVISPPPGDVMVSISGVAVSARIVDGSGEHIFDCDVSDEAGTATIRLPDTQLWAGGLTRMTSGVLR